MIPYRRSDAVAYAERWALNRNPRYFNFVTLGGDCTNFVSQCIYAGCGIMNYTPDTGWYYISPSDRAAAWTSVPYFYRFMTTNLGSGPYASIVGRDEIAPGDVIQLGDADSRFYHSLLILEASPAEIYVAAHSNDALWRPLSTYHFAQARFLHIEGARE